MSNSYSLNSFQNIIFDLAREYDELAPNDIFTLFYKTVLGQRHGPRFSSFVSVYGKDCVMQQIEKATVSGHKFSKEDVSTYHDIKNSKKFLDYYGLTQKFREASSFRSKLPGTIIAIGSKVTIARFSNLPGDLKNDIYDIIGDAVNDNHHPDDLCFNSFTYVKDHFINASDKISDVGKIISDHGIFTDNFVFEASQKALRDSEIEAIDMEEVNFCDLSERASSFADYLNYNKDAIAESLNDYECYNVVMDEIERSVELLYNLEKNSDYFTHKVNGVTTFLPLNQPLYATVCFGVIPSLMSNVASVRPPTAMQDVFKKLEKAAKFSDFFSNLEFSYEKKEDFVERRSKVSDVVIFTGSTENGNKVRKLFPFNTLFILNGSGHNPLVVTNTADLNMAKESALRVVLQNQGQDCAGPNAILVQEGVYEFFKEDLLASLKNIETKVGDYKNINNIVGPNTDCKHTLKVAKFFLENRK